MASVCNEDISKYGVIEPKQVNKNIYRIISLVEKPDMSHTPLSLGIVDRYILQTEIFDALLK
jgi:UTP--glucose-1-phosphate uridylyltransferase